MRTAKDQNLQEQQFFYRINRNKATWNSPVVSPANSALFVKPKNTRHPSTQKRTTPPTVDTNRKSSISKLIVNKVPQTSTSRGGRHNSIALLDKSSLGKLPGLIMSELQSSTNFASAGKTFDVSVVQNASPTLSNLLRKNSSVIDEKVRITLQPLRQGSGTQLVRSRSPNESQDNAKYFANKRKTSKNLDNSESISKIVEAQQNSAALPVNKGTKPKLVIQPRETKISKILREIRWNIVDSDGESRGESQEKEVQKIAAASSLKNSFVIKSKSVLKSAKTKEPNNAEIVENKHSNQKGVGIPKKFISYRNVLDSQTLTFMKARAPLMQEPRDSIIDVSTEVIAVEVIPPFFRNMKANLSARNREVRQKFAKTINYIIRKLSLLNLTLEEVITKKPFPSEPYEREGSRPLLDAAKIGNISEVETILILNPYLVYEYDLLKQTAVHWAARRGYTKMLKMLLEKGADPDARDVSGRTPLFLAARGSLLNSVKLLLFYGANPMIKSGAGRLAIDYATELHIKSLLTRGYKLHAFLGTYSGKRFKQTWVLMDKHEFEVNDAELE